MNQILTNKLPFLFLLIVLYSCTTTTLWQEKLEKALLSAKGNRGELEKVLFHYQAYSKDSLKYKAAQFLIVNMPGHSSFRDSTLIVYDYFIDNVYGSLAQETKLFLHCLPGIYEYSPEGEIEDIQSVTADFLIGHIDYKFKQWNQSPWKSQISFNSFCEYILPYRLDEESVSFKAIDTTNTCLFKNLVSKLYCDDNNLRIKDVVNATLFDLVNKKLELTNSVKDSLPAPVYNFKGADVCIPGVYVTAAFFRSLCVPCTIDFIPYIPNKNGTHYENSILFSGSKSFPPEEMDYNIPKVYRITYSHNDIPKAGMNHIPEIFKNPFRKDVTDLYTTTFDIDISLNNCGNGRDNYAYLGVFTNREWCLTTWGSVTDNGKVLFKKVGAGVLYVPFFFRRNQRVIGGYPFLVDIEGNSKKFIPDRKNLISMTLKRKYPMTTYKKKWIHNLANLGVMLSDDPNFAKDKIEVFSISSIRNINLYYSLPINRKGRYMRLFTKDNSKESPEISEVSVYSDGVKIKDIVLCGNRDTSYEKMIDNLPLTYKSLDENGVIFNLGKELSVDSVYFMPRNDDNFIYPGDMYQLLYWDINGWNVISTKLADNHEIEFENIPSGAVYWIRNLTKGVEEALFKYEGGKPVFF